MELQVSLQRSEVEAPRDQLKHAGIREVLEVEEGIGSGSGGALSPESLPKVQGVDDKAVGLSREGEPADESAVIRNVLLEADLESEGTQLVKNSGHLAEKGDRVDDHSLLRLLEGRPQLRQLGLEEIEGKLLNLLLKGLVDSLSLISHNPPRPD